MIKTGRTKRLDQMPMGSKPLPETVRVGESEYRRHKSRLTLRLRSPRLMSTSHTYEHLVTSDNPTGELRSTVIKGDGTEGALVVFSVVSPDGALTPQDQPILVELSGHGKPLTANLWHWEYVGHYESGMDRIHLTVHLPDDRISWVWSRLLENPRAEVAVSFNVVIWQLGWNYYLPRGARLEVSDIGIVVETPVPTANNPGEASVAAAPDTPTATPPPAVTPAGQPLPTWFPWATIALLAAIWFNLAF